MLGNTKGMPSITSKLIRSVWDRWSDDSVDSTNCNDKKEWENSLNTEMERLPRYTKGGKHSTKWYK